MGYLEKFKASRFYYPSHGIKVVESISAKFFQNGVIVGFLKSWT